jgi:hypothetical protein
MDVSLLQSLSYVAAAIGVCAAAMYYMMVLRATQINMRHTLETRRVMMVRDITKEMQNEAYTRSFYELMNYEWKDFEDFDRKYGSENNVEASARRASVFINMNSRGAMLRKGVLSIEDIFDSTGGMALVFLWEKYRPIVEEFRRRYLSQLYMRDFEFLAGEMQRYVKTHEPSYEIPETFFKYVRN